MAFLQLQCFFIRKMIVFPHLKVAHSRNIMPTDVSSLKTVLEFKTSTLSVPVLHLSVNVLQQIELQLLEKIAQAPEFFKNSPVLIDLQKLTVQNLTISVAEIVGLLRKHGFLPVGIRGGNEAQSADALAMNLPVYAYHAQNTSQPAEQKPFKSFPEPEKEVATAANASSENKLVTQQVRSGQRVYAKGDLIITASVSAGAEIMAEGNIHIYGTLRGRALAGVLGNSESRIFCSDLQEELISIAGFYQLRDDLNYQSSHKPVQICLDNQTLIIKEI